MNRAPVFSQKNTGFVCIFFEHKPLLVHKIAIEVHKLEWVKAKMLGDGFLFAPLQINKSWFFAAFVAALAPELGKFLKEFLGVHSSH
jgi:hypothetical protein